MHVFLQGPRNVGKTTVIRKTLSILMARKPLILGGFFTWNGGKDDPCVYMQPARPDVEGERYKLAGFNMEKGGLICDIQVFERDGARLLSISKGAELIIMDELGFLESSALNFRRAVLDTLAGDTPVFGTLRLGDVPWHNEIKSNPLVKLYDVSEKNRDTLPPELAKALSEECEL